MLHFWVVQIIPFSSGVAGLPWCCCMVCRNFRLLLLLLCDDDGCCVVCCRFSAKGLKKCSFRSNLFTWYNIVFCAKYHIDYFKFHI